MVGRWVVREVMLGGREDGGRRGGGRGGAGEEAGQHLLMDERLEGGSCTWRQVARGTCWGAVWGSQPSSRGTSNRTLWTRCVAENVGEKALAYPHVHSRGGE